MAHSTKNAFAAPNGDVSEKRLLTFDEMAAGTYPPSQQAFRGELSALFDADNKARPGDTTQYSIDDVVSGASNSNWVFENMGTLGALIEIRALTLRIDVASVPSGMGAFRLHLFNKSPTVIADNAAFTIIAADWDKYLGYLDLETPQDFGAVLWSQNFYDRHTFKLAADETALYGQLVTRAQYTPTASVNKRLAMTGIQIGS